jgi:hypothetical protein
LASSAVAAAPVSFRAAAADAVAEAAEVGADVPVAVAAAETPVLLDEPHAVAAAASAAARRTAGTARPRLRSRLGRLPENNGDTIKDLR